MLTLIGLYKEKVKVTFELRTKMKLIYNLEKKWKIRR